MRFLKYLFLIIPWVATLWVPFYASDQPELGGMPFFFWYQFLWIIISAVLTAIVYKMDSKKERGAR